MFDICYIAYDPYFKERAERFLLTLRLELSVVVMTEGILERVVAEGAKVILARGGTAERLRQKHLVPVVELPISVQDVVSALVAASRKGTQVGIIGYGNFLGGLEHLNPLLQNKLTQAVATDRADTERKIREFCANGIDVVVGGFHQTNYARTLGLETVLIDLSQEALSTAYSEAVSILKSLEFQHRKEEERKAILRNSTEGYIAFDISRRITLVNPVAMRYTAERNLLGRDFLEIFPELSPALQVLEQPLPVRNLACKLHQRAVLCHAVALSDPSRKVLGGFVILNDAGDIRHGEHAIRNKLYSKGLYATHHIEDLLGDSPQMQLLREMAVQFAQTDATILITGETGVGKELFAQSIHNESNRKKGPFVAVNCASLPESILESELFGYEEGAFTGAKKGGKTGLFELAHGGTIFLDEISEIPLRLQGMLLRVLQEKQIMRLGSDEIIPVNIRVIAATNISLSQAMERKTFRPDLFYRLNVLTLVIPPLRERPEDLALLAAHFGAAQPQPPQLSAEGLLEMQRYGWPGNVRQLENFLQKIGILGRGRPLTGEWIATVIAQYEPPLPPNPTEAAGLKREMITKESVVDALRLFGGNKQKAAAFLQIHRSTLWRLLQKYDL